MPVARNHRHPVQPGERRRVRDAVPSDAEAISDLRVATWKVAYRGLLPDVYLDALDATREYARRREQLADPLPRSACLVIETAGVIDGFVFGGPSRDTDDAAGEIYAIYVRQECWGAGLGQALLAAALARLAREGFGTITLWTLHGNSRADRFYRAAGFRLDGARKAYEQAGATFDLRRYRRD